jgi:hypothetical protein
MGDKDSNKRKRQREIMTKKNISDVEAAFEIFVQDIAIPTEYIFSSTHIIMDLSFGINTITWKQYQLSEKYTSYIYMAENTRNYVPRNKYMGAINALRCNYFNTNNIRFDNLFDEALQHHLLIVWPSSKQRGMPKDYSISQPKDESFSGKYEIGRMKFTKLMECKSEKDRITPVDFESSTFSKIFIDLKRIPDDGNTYQYSDDFIKELFESCKDSTSFKFIWGEDLWKLITPMIDYHPVTQKRGRKRKAAE